VALVVMIEHGGEGSRVAAPIARKILDKYFAR
jgi:cell division protein FtsI/penicillin-binding protein 2